MPAAVALVLAIPPKTQAAQAAPAIIFDPGMAVWHYPAPTLDVLRDLGTDTVRLRVAYADNPDLRRLDAAVKEAHQRHMDVLLTPVGPAPSVTAYAAFVGDLGRRYPEIRRWAIYNEPDLPQLFPLPGQGGYEPGDAGPTVPQPDPGVLVADPEALDAPTEPGLSNDSVPLEDPEVPEYPFFEGDTLDRTVGHPIARLYRSVFLAAQRELLAAGHGRRQVLIGETSPAPPPGFVASVLRGRPIVAGGWAHHPYIAGDKASARTPYLGPGNLPKLRRTLARAPGRTLPIYVTEFGVKDHQGSVAMREAARVMGRLSYVRSFAQYTLHDDWFGTGLIRMDGSPKPTLRSFAKVGRSIRARR